MANQDKSQLEDVKDVATAEKPVTKRTRKPKAKTADTGTAASLFGFAPYQLKKNEEYIISKYRIIYTYVYEL